MNTPLYPPGKRGHPFKSSDVRIRTYLHSVEDFDIYLADNGLPFCVLYVIGPAGRFGGLDFNRMDGNEPGMWLFCEPAVPAAVAEYVLAMLQLHA